MDRLAGLMLPSSYLGNIGTQSSDLTSKTRYEIRDPHLVEESVLKILKEKTDFADYRPRPFNMREFYERTGHDIKEMLLSCSYRGTECSAEHFKVEYGVGWRH